MTIERTDEFFAKVTEINKWIRQNRSSLNYSDLCAEIDRLLPGLRKDFEDRIKSFYNFLEYQNDAGGVSLEQHFRSADSIMDLANYAQRIKPTNPAEAYLMEVFVNLRRVYEMTWGSDPDFQP